MFTEEAVAEMRVEHGLPVRSAANAPPAVITIGNFDGVHRGHQLLLDTACTIAAGIGGESVVITFEPHPRCVLRPDDCPASITTLDEKRDRIASRGIDRLIVMPFTREVSQWSAEMFVDTLIGGAGLRHLVVGHDFALGHERRGTVAFLREYGSRHGFDVTAVGGVLDGAEPVSSSRVRAAVVEGEMETAAALLGYPYFIDARVEHGAHVGRSLGFPTANLSVTAGKCLPRRGIYTSWANVGGRWFMAATNVGYRPTFGGDRLLVEAYLLGFDADIYQQPIRLAFAERLRDEVAFAGAAELVEQMHRDVATTRERLAAAEPPGILERVP